MARAQALAAVALGALAAVALVSLHGSQHTTELASNPGFKPYKGQMLFTLNDFASGRVSYPSQNLANGQGIPQPAANGADHSHVMWGNGFRPFTGGQKLFSIEDFDSGRVSFPEEGQRGVRQVVKSTDFNIDPAGAGKDHVWNHQTTHGPVEYQDWPLEMPGMKAPMTQLSAVRTKGKKALRLSTKLDSMQRQAALDLGKVGTELQVAATQMLVNKGPQRRRGMKKGVKRIAPQM